MVKHSNACEGHRVKPDDPHKQFSDRLSDIERFQRASLRMNPGNGTARSHQSHYSPSSTTQIPGLWPDQMDAPALKTCKVEDDLRWSVLMGES
ncbi:runt-related transcription factor [Pimephales promelas]|nr:runt-related transcription factor [Pimephales promelas]